MNKVVLISLFLLLLSCNNNIVKKNRYYNKEECEWNYRFYNRLMSKGNVLYNLVSKRNNDNLRLKEILEDDYGVYVFFGTDIYECDKLIDQIDNKFYSKFDNKLVDSIERVADSINKTYDELSYSRDGIPMTYSVYPKFVGTKSSLDSLQDLENISCPSEYASDTFMISYKLWLDTNGNIVRQKQLLKYGWYWDSVVNKLMERGIQYSPAYKINSSGQLYKVPSIIYLDFWRRIFYRKGGHPE